MKMLILRRSGRSSPSTPASEASVSGLASSRSASVVGSELGGSPAGTSPSGSPLPGGSSKAGQLLRRHRPSALRTLLMALLPALILASTAASMRQRHRARSRLADELLAAARSGRAHAARQLGEAAGSVVAGKACADALKIPQVAMLFLVKGPLRHEAVWRAWFERAGGLLPAQAVSNALCATEDAMPDALAACSSLAGGHRGMAIAGAATQQQQQQQSSSGSIASESSSDGSSWQHWIPEGGHSSQPVPPGVLDRQHLFDVYVHPHPSFTGYPAGSLLHGRELRDSERVATEWGSHSLVDAAEALLSAALRNPRNQKFFMLSESDLPLYSPEVMYLQLMSEHRSRLNACNTTEGWDLDFYRWVDRMETRFLSKELWRKSSQWFVLNRKHAELILADRKVERVFQEHCRTMWEEERSEERVCYPDEHYFATLLAVHGLDNETDCQGRFMDVDWSRVSSTSPHPWEYKQSEVGDQLFHALRRPQRTGCSKAVGALATAPAAFLPQQQLFASAAAAEASATNVPELERLGRGVCHQLLLHQQEQPKYPGIGPECPLMARKFSDETVKAALMSLAPCDSTTMILNDGWCPGEGPRQRALRQLWWHMAPWVLLCSCLLVAAPLLNYLVPLGLLPHIFSRLYPQSDARLTSPLLDV